MAVLTTPHEMANFPNFYIIEKIYPFFDKITLTSGYVNNAQY